MFDKYIGSYIDTSMACIEAMFGISCVIQSEYQQLNIFTPQNELTVNIPFSGAISGDYFLSIKENEWVEFFQSSLGDGSTEMINSCVKELLNTIVGDAIQSIQDDFAELTFLSPRIYRGGIDYPETMTLTSTICSDNFSDIQLSLCLNLMKQDIGLKLEESLKEASVEKSKARKAQTAILSIMDSIDQGIFNIDERGIISPGCSKALGSIFKKDITLIEDVYFDEACNIEIVKNRLGEMKNWLDFAKHAPEGMAWSDITHLAPYHEERFSINETKFIYNFTYHKATHDDEIIFMVIVEDITEKRKAELMLQEAHAQHENNMDLLNTVLTLNSSELFSFLNECDNMLTDIEEISKNSPISKESINHLFRGVHSLKGGAATLNFKDLSQAAHLVEDHLDQIQRANDTSDANISKENINSIKDELNNIYTIVNRLNIKKPSEITETGKTILIKISNIDKLIETAGSLTKSELTEELQKLKMVSLSSFKTTLNPMVEDLCKQLNKKATLVIDTTCHLPLELFNKLSSPLIHLIRNSLDHGIEAPEQRKKAGKNAIATITLSASREGQSFIFNLSDDGRGIQTKTISEIALKKNIINDNDKLSEDELIALIFHPGLSTKNQVSNISGRGVGLDSVKVSIEEYDGQINVKSNPGKGTAFTFNIPSLNEKER